jgi:hypothetical protein
MVRSWHPAWTLPPAGHGPPPARAGPRIAQSAGHLGAKRSWSVLPRLFETSDRQSAWRRFTRCSPVDVLDGVVPAAHRPPAQEIVGLRLGGRWLIRDVLPANLDGFAVDLGDFVRTRAAAPPRDSALATMRSRADWQRRRSAAMARSTAGCRVSTPPCARPGRARARHGQHYSAGPLVSLWATAVEPCASLGRAHANRRGALATAVRCLPGRWASVGPKAFSPVAIAGMAGRALAHHVNAASIIWRCVLHRVKAE